MFASERRYLAHSRCRHAPRPHSAVTLAPRDAPSHSPLTAIVRLRALSRAFTLPSRDPSRRCHSLVPPLSILALTPGAPRTHDALWRPVAVLRPRVAATPPQQAPSHGSWPHAALACLRAATTCPDGTFSRLVPPPPLPRTSRAPLLPSRALVAPPLSRRLRAPSPALGGHRFHLDPLATLSPRAAPPLRALAPHGAASPPSRALPYPLVPHTACLHRLAALLRPMAPRCLCYAISCRHAASPPLCTPSHRVAAFLCHFTLRRLAPFSAICTPCPSVCTPHRIVSHSVALRRALSTPHCDAFMPHGAV
ncbi:hypothetical protein DENSPDRAFT_934305 [Dentipellis sp. KUC8613]|nr:hypothetical protein DENSPDRAFT_934305 [Dentipellis sp. KUC8613]